MGAMMWLLLCSGFFMTVGGSLAAFLVATRSQKPSERSSVENSGKNERKRQEIADRELFQAIEKEARALSQLIPEHLATQNKLQHITREPGKKRRKNLVRFEAILMTRTEIWFRFDGRRLPYGVSFTDLKDPNNAVLENLQHGINRPCRFYEDHQFNLFLRVGLKNSLMGIPRKVRWADVVEMLPESRPFAVAVGVNEFNKLVYQDITEWPHGIIGGATGMGKTTALTQILITLIKRNPPSRMKFVIIDLKRTEMRQFLDLPHTWHYGDRPDEVLDVLQKIEREMNRRYDLFTDVCRDIRGWNRQNPHRRLHRILVAIDELASITTDPELGRTALKKLVNLARLGRSAGIHLLLCTQFVSKAVLPMSVTANIEGRLCFSLNNSSASTLIMGNGVAYGLSHVGRCVYQSGPDYLFLQAPYATDKEIEDVLTEAKEGKADEAAGAGVPTDHMDLLKLALYNYGGSASYRDLWQSVKDVGGSLGQRKVIEMLAACEYSPESQEPIFEIEGERYILLPSILTTEGHTGRRLVATNGQLPTTDAEIEEMALLQDTPRISLREQEDGLDQEHEPALPQSI